MTRRKHGNLGLAIWLTLGSGVAAAGACSATSSSGSTGFETGSGGGATSTGPGQGGDTTSTFVTSGTAASTMSGFNPVTSSTGVGGGCAGSSVKAELRPLDLYVMLDQSSSMTGTVAGGITRWKAVTDAIANFVQQPSTAGLGIGLGYFGVSPSGTSCNSSCSVAADCGGPGCGPCQHFGGQGICIGASSGGSSCNPADYAVADVEIAELPGMANAQSDAIVASMMAHHPTTGTPTAPALQGAIMHASAWMTANPTHVAVAVFATDGEPSECSPSSIPQIAQIAADGFMANPSVITFVIGVGSSISSLNAIAQAGGSDHAFIVNTQQDVTMQFVAALDTIRGAALGCTYLIPVPENGDDVDFTKVNVQYSPGDGSPPVTIPQVLDILHCPATGDAWYYDDPANPTQIVMCSNTCTTLSADTTGQVDIVLGCETIVH